jgi:hypothetical protein
MLGELDQLTGQQLQRPTGAAHGRLGTGSRDQNGFLFARELALRPRTWLFAERGLQVTEHEAAHSSVPPLVEARTNS